MKKEKAIIIKQRPFQEILRDWRAIHGWVQKEAADVLKVSVRTYEGWEQGKTEPRELAMWEIQRRMAIQVSPAPPSHPPA